MAAKGKETRHKVVKKTCQNGTKTSTVNKAKSPKKYRGQGR